MTLEKSYWIGRVQPVFVDFFNDITQFVCSHWALSHARLQSNRQSYYDNVTYTMLEFGFLLGRCWTCPKTLYQLDVLLLEFLIKPSIIYKNKLVCSIIFLLTFLKLQEMVMVMYLTGLVKLWHTFHLDLKGCS